MIHKSNLTSILTVIGLVFLVSAAIYMYKQDEYPEPTFQFLDGSRTSLQDFRGKPVIVLFWSTSCQICLQELPHLKEFYSEFTNNEFEIIAVAMPYDPPNRVVDIADLMDLPFPIAIDIDAQTVRAFGNISLTPTTVVISPQGKIISMATGIIDLNIIRNIVLHYISTKNINSA